MMIFIGMGGAVSYVQVKPCARLSREVKKKTYPYPCLQMDIWDGQHIKGWYLMTQEELLGWDVG